MKKTILITSLAFLCVASTVLFFSCKKEANVPTTKERNSKALADVNQNITRAELASLALTEQMETWNALTDANKLRIFHEKVDLVLNTETLTAPEQAHLNSLYTLFDETIYEEEHEDPTEYEEDWVEYAVNTLGWDDEMIYWYVETWSTPTEVANRPIDMGGGSPDHDCKCRSRFACSFGLSACTGGGCNETRRGCGFFGSRGCVGDCPPD